MRGSTTCYRRGVMVKNDLHTLVTVLEQCLSGGISVPLIILISLAGCQVWLEHHAMAKIGSLFIGICWEIWRNRNEDIFQNIKKDNWASVKSYHSSLINALVRHEDRPVLRNVR